MVNESWRDSRPEAARSCQKIISRTLKHNNTRSLLYLMEFFGSYDPSTGSLAQLEDLSRSRVEIYPDDVNDESIKKIAQYITQSTQLKTLILHCGCRFELTAIIVALKTNQSVTELDIRMTPNEKASYRIILFGQTSFISSYQRMSDMFAKMWKNSNRSLRRVIFPEKEMRVYEYYKGDYNLVQPQLAEMLEQNRREQDALKSSTMLFLRMFLLKKSIFIELLPEEIWLIIIKYITFPGSPDFVQELTFLARTLKPFVLGGTTERK